MKIAFITYEYPPDTAFGGIATYVYQAAKMLHNRGHYVEIFAGSHYRSCTYNSDGFLVHRVKELDLWNFYKPIGQIFAQRHNVVQFDILEGPDYSADAREAVRLVPHIPLVVKLHTPSIVLFKLNCSTYNSTSFSTKARYYFNSLLKGIKPQWGYDPTFLRYREQTMKMNEIERLHILDADEIASPSTALGKMLIDEWCLKPDLISHIPYPYQPSDILLNIPIDTNTNVVTFLGRLEIRKGILDLAKAIPLVLHQLPKTKFRFVGSSDVSPEPNVSMEQYLKRMLQNYERNLEFTGAVPMDSIPDILNATDICVFPSIWENFPFVCLESMAAGRGIIASKAGGMKDMLEDKAGMLIPPGNPNYITKALIDLLKDKEQRMGLGQAARKHLLEEYNADRIGPLQEASYLRAKERRRDKGPRPINRNN